MYGPVVSGEADTSSRLAFCTTNASQLPKDDCLTSHHLGPANHFRHTGIEIAAITRELVQAVNTRRSSQRDEVWSQLANEFSATPDLVQYDDGRQNLAQFLESLKHLVTANQSYTISIVDLAVYLQLNVTFAEVFLNMEISGLGAKSEASRIVRQAVCILKFRLIEGQWKCHKYDAMRGQI